LIRERILPPDIGSADVARIAVADAPVHESTRDRISERLYDSRTATGATVPKQRCSSGKRDE
jgi:hypothetical protein